MNQKIKIFISGFALIFGALLLVGAGCSNKSLTDDAGNQDALNDGGPGVPAGEGEEDSADVYGSAEEIATPAGLPSELKSLLSEACGEVKLTTLTYNLAGMNTDLMVYTWKNKPTEEKLMSLFKKNGYEVETLVVGIFTATKDRSFLTVDWNSADREEGHEIVVSSDHE